MISDTSSPTYRQLNTGGDWPGARVEGLVRDPDGALRLPRLPAPPVWDGPVPAGGPCGVAATPQGAVCFIDPGSGGLHVLRPLADRLRLAHAPGPGTVSDLSVTTACDLVVAGTTTGAVDVYDLETATRRDVWTGFDTPIAVAASRTGRVFIADAGDRTLRCRDAAGRRERSVETALRAALPGPAARLAMAETADGGERLIVVCRAARPQLLVITLGGRIDASATRNLVDVDLGSVMDLAVDDGTIHLLTDDGWIRSVTLDGHLSGVTPAPGICGIGPGPTGLVAVWADGTAGPLPSRHAAQGSVTLRTPNPPDDTRWNGVRALLRGRDTEGHVRIATLTSTTAAADPPTWLEPGMAPGTTTPPGTWRVGPLDVESVRVLNEPSETLWIRIELLSDGTSTPRLDQVRVTADRGGLMRYLPAVYQEDPAGAELTAQVMSLLADALEPLEAAGADLPRRLDPKTAHSGRSGATVGCSAERSELEQLAWLLGIDLRVPIAEETLRRRIAAAIPSADTRGTLEHLREQVRTVIAGPSVPAPPVAVTEPIASLSIWSLGGDGRSSALGLTTMLTAAHPQGAALDHAATLDVDHIDPDPEHFGAPLYQDLANRVCVHVHRRHVDRPQKLEAVRSTVERERPGHVSAHLRVVEPRTVVAAQSTIGIDMVVGSPRRPSRLGDDTALGRSTHLPAVRPTLVGSVLAGNGVAPATAHHRGGHLVEGLTDV